MVSLHRILGLSALLCCAVISPMTAQVKVAYDRFADRTTFYTDKHPPEGFRWKVQIMVEAECKGKVETCPLNTEVDLGFRLLSSDAHVVRILFDGKDMREYAGALDFPRNLLMVRLTPDDFRLLASASVVDIQLTGDDRRKLEMRLSKENMEAVRALSQHLK